MEISPYIAQSLKNPAPKIFFTPEDIIYDRRMSMRDKRMILQNPQLLKNGLVHASR